MWGLGFGVFSLGILAEGLIKGKGLGCWDSRVHDFRV